MFSFNSQIIAQSLNTLSGVVLDKSTGEELLGVNVRIEGTTNGTITDFNGSFSLMNVAVNSNVTFSYIGMKSVTIKVANFKPMTIMMESDATGLEEVVVVGYGTSKKRDLTGSIVSVSGDDLKTSPDGNPIKSLQGKVPGLMITNSGSAGASPTIRLRGVATVNASTNPLYVVDGMFVDNIDFVNPNDITSVEVLKDPSSLAIFGVQGANGVIILTTRRAEKGKISLNYDGYAGVQVVHNRDRLNLTNASEFTMLYNEQLRNEATATHPYQEWIPDLLGKGTDWQSEILRSAFITNHGVTVSSASEKSSSVLSLGYFKQEGVVKYNDYSRINVRYAGDYQVTNFLKVGSNMTLSRWESDGETASVANAAQAIPTYTPYAPEEDYDPNNIGSQFTPSPSIQKDVTNPVALMEINKGNSENYGYRGVGNIYAEIKFLKDFTFRATGYADIGYNLGSTFTPKFDVNNSTSISSHRSEKTSFRRNTDEYTKYQADFILNYNKNINKHRIGAMAGYTARIQEGKGFWASADTLINNDTWVVPSDFWMLNMGSALNRSNGDWYSSEAFVSYLGRVNYSYADKYLLTATFRADASSKFSPNKRWGYFPSVGMGWIMSEESFMQNASPVINYLKFKASWGQLGNDKIGNYLWFPAINPMGQQVIIDGKVYYIPTVNNMVDENIHWEIVTGLDFGFDAQMFDNRLAVDLGFYSKKTSDLLAYVAPTVSVGAGYAITNAGSLRNSGVELMLSWRDKIGDFSYGISVNGATLKNKVLSLGNENNDIVTGLYHRTRVGGSVGAIYGYKQDGIFQNQAEIDEFNAKYEHPWNLAPGDIRYQDTNNDGRIDDKDRVEIGKSIPTLTYGLTLNAGYKNFDLSVDFNGVHGNKIIDVKRLPGFATFNFYSHNLDRWHGEGTSNKNPILAPSRAHNYLPSDNLLESGSYFRIRAIQLGYTLPKSICKKMQITNMRFFVNTQNPLTFKKNSGYTPEVGGGILDGGIDAGGTYPLPTTYTAGLTLSF